MCGKRCGTATWCDVSECVLTMASPILYVCFPNSLTPIRPGAFHTLRGNSSEHRGLIISISIRTNDSYHWLCVCRALYFRSHNGNCCCLFALLSQFIDYAIFMDGYVRVSRAVPTPDIAYRMLLNSDGDGWRPETHRWQTEWLQMRYRFLFLNGKFFGALISIRCSRITKTL